MSWTALMNVRNYCLRRPLATAFIISLCVHVSLYGVYSFGKKHNWWDYQATWLMNWQKKLQAKKKKLTPEMEQAQLQALKEISLTFVEVDPVVASQQAPKEAKFYGAQNSVAANPEPPVEVEKPKLDGNQDKMVRLADVPKPNPQPLQPAPPPEQIKPEEKPTEMAKAKPPDVPGDLGIEKPATEPPKKEKIRSLAEARAAKNMLTGEKLKQDGGVKRRGSVSLDVKATPFGAYDAAFIAAVQQRWYDLLETTSIAQRSGKVVLHFRLTYDGRIRDLKIADNEVGDLLGLLCQRAIEDPAPFPKWPDDMRRMIGQNHRDVMFTFYYN